MSDFKKGDVVQLKSGGPAMTITSTGGGTVTCEWFDKHDMPQARVFEPEAVELYQPVGF